jgi:anti-sigma-K factor RskA
MTSDMNPDRIDDLIALAALGELSAHDRRELDEAVQNDPALAADLDEALHIAAALQGPHAEAPPVALRDSVLAAIAATPQDHPGAVDPADQPHQPAVVSLEGRRARRRFGPSLFAAAAVALFAIGGVVAVVSNDSATDPIAAVIEASDATSRPLAGEIGDLTVVYSASLDALVIEGDGVPTLDESSTYQLWLVGDDGATSVGVFRPDADGSVSERFGDADPTDFVVGVTREPAGGSESPTLPILASA